MTQSRVLIPLTFLATVLVGGCIAQVIIETVNGKPADVNPVLAALAGSAVSALFGQFAFLGHTQAAAIQRADMLDALVGPPRTANGPTGSAIGEHVASTGPTPATSGTATTPLSDRP